MNRVRSPKPSIGDYPGPTREELGDVGASVDASDWRATTRPRPPVVTPVPGEVIGPEVRVSSGEAVGVDSSREAKVGPSPELQSVPSDQILDELDRIRAALKKRPTAPSS